MSKQKTTDDGSYHVRTQMGNKPNAIKQFVADKKVKSVLDLGCNNGAISYPLQKDLGISVTGIDDGDNLKIPKDYNYVKNNILNVNKIYIQDATLLLSVYHHIFGAYGESVADDLFFKYLLRSEYLIFDVGNTSEIARTRQYWFKAMVGKYSNEKSLLDHFNISYDTIANWCTGGGNRKVVVFSKKSFDENAIVVDTFKRRIGSAKQKFGLVSDANRRPTKTSEKLFDKTLFCKLRVGGKTFFAKKHLDKKMHNEELENIKLVYDETNPSELLTFYGVSENFGFIYEWVDNFKYIRKTNLELKTKVLTDVDLIKVGEREIFIDFWR